MTLPGRRWGLLLLVLCLLAAALQVRVGGGAVSENPVRPRSAPLDLETYSPAPPGTPINLLFIHHSCGAQLLAEPGPEASRGAILLAHPNGGGLRALLTADGYRVNEATYGSRVGERTGIVDWPRKFAEDMEAILTCATQDESLPQGRRNRVVLFKSCFPNNRLLGDGEPPGKPAGPDLTVWNAKAAYTALLPFFVEEPETLFVLMTPPPLAPHLDPVPLWKYLVRQLAGRNAGNELAGSGERARGLNDWLRNPKGWLKDYPAKNVVVFDYYDLLTKEGRSNLSCYASKSGRDSHPNQQGNRRTAEALVAVLNRAVRRALIVGN